MTTNNTEGAEWEKEFEEQFTVASFTWNGDNKTGLDFAKKTRKKVKSFITHQRQQAVAEFAREVITQIGRRYEVDYNHNEEPALIPCEHNQALEQIIDDIHTLLEKRNISI